MTTSRLAIQVIDADTPRADIEEAIGHAKRSMHGETDALRRERLRSFIDALLDMWEVAR
ncbi:MAG: hypothetical protein ACRDYZ_12065 [Acidimicrobiales bacterium]